MLSRRSLITGSIAAAASLIGFTNRARISASHWLLQSAQQNGGPAGTPYPLVALPTKKPLGQVYDLPPNYETPMHHLIGQRNYPLTDPEYYYVRYREASPPKLNWADFRLKVSGDAIENPREFSMADLREFEQVKVAAVGECSGLGRGLLRPLVPGMPWTKGDFGCAEWTGASLKAVLESCGLKDNAKIVTFRSGANTISRKKPDYIRSFLPETVLTDDALLAYYQNGTTLNFWNGYPLRVVVPGTVAPRWVKQVVEIEVRTTDDDREWSGRETGPGLMNTKSLITNPPDGTEVTVGDELKIKGVAWDHGQGTERVEISTDDGETWTEAELEERISPYAWTVFNATVKVDREGPFRVLSRATSTDGDDTQPTEEPQSTFDNGGRQSIGAKTFAAVYVGTPA